MPPQPDRQAILVEAYYRLQAQGAAGAAADLVRLLRDLDLDDVDAAWAAVRGQVLAAIAARQLTAANTSQAFFTALLQLLGLAPQPLERVPAEAFAGWTAAGAPLASVVDATPILVKVGIRAGLTPERALTTATIRVVRIAASEVQDAGRGMLEAQTRLEPQAHGYVRKVKLPACGRCLVLAGRVYSKSTGFARHPGCDCAMVPVFVASPDVREPRDLFHEMTDAQQDKAFGVAGARAVRDGADPSAVLNAHRGMSAPGDDYTSEGSSRRGAFYRQQKAAGNVDTRGRLTVSRLSPQGVARMAGDDTKRYRHLLRDNGYVA